MPRIAKKIGHLPKLVSSWRVVGILLVDDLPQHALWRGGSLPSMTAGISANCKTGSRPGAATLSGYLLRAAMRHMLHAAADDLKGPVLSRGRRSRRRLSKRLRWPLVFLPASRGRTVPIAVQTRTVPLPSTSIFSLGL